jgi:hypothetical protein
MALRRVYVGARRLTAEEGLLAGTASSLNAAGAIELAGELGSGHTVVTVAVDTRLRYLAVDLDQTAYPFDSRPRQAVAEVLRRPPEHAARMHPSTRR